MADTMVPRFLIVLQYLLIGYFLLFHPFSLPLGWGVIVLGALGCGLGLFALSARAHGSKGERGPYRYLRYPLTLALLLIVSGFLLDYPALPHFLAGGVLLVVLLLKMRKEEQYRVLHRPEYAAYQKHTKLFLPFLY